MLRKPLLFMFVWTTLALGGCNEGADEPTVDPRCETLCSDAPGCTSASIRRCKDDCAARIEGTTSVCANCILEGADFSVGRWGNTEGDPIECTADYRPVTECSMLCTGSM